MGVPASAAQKRLVFHGFKVKVSDALRVRLAHEVGECVTSVKVLANIIELYPLFLQAL